MLMYALAFRQYFCTAVVAVVLKSVRLYEVRSSLLVLHCYNIEIYIGCYILCL